MRLARLRHRLKKVKTTLNRDGLHPSLRRPPSFHGIFDLRGKCRLVGRLEKPFLNDLRNYSVFQRRLRVSHQIFCYCDTRPTLQLSIWGLWQVGQPDFGVNALRLSRVLLLCGVAQASDGPNQL